MADGFWSRRGGGGGSCLTRGIRTRPEGKEGATTERIRNRKELRGRETGGLQLRQ